MSLFKRIGNIIRSNKEKPPLPGQNPFEETGVGDIVQVEFQEYIVTGKVVYFDRGYAPHRFAYYLQNGRSISCLLVEKGRTYETFFCEFLEGSLEDPNDVPSTIEIDEDRSFELEHHRNDMTRTEGHTDFRVGDEVIFWRYYGEGESYFFLQWQDGKFIAMQGERLQPSEVKFMRSSR